jgi:hypothetical protein
VGALTLVEQERTLHEGLRELGVSGLSEVFFSRAGPDGWHHTRTTGLCGSVCMHPDFVRA